MHASAGIGSRMRLSTIAFLVFALAAAAVCVRLGFWQLDRREMRQASNAMIVARSRQPAVPVQSLSGDTADLRFRQAIVTGEPDYEREILLSHRGHQGAPGVDVLTPMRVPGSDSAVLVNRGWVYAADGMTIDRARWRERDTTFSGYVESFESATTDSLRDGMIRRPSHEAIARALPYPIRRFYVVALDDSVSMADSTPGRPAIVRLQAPKLGEGPHLSYAIQWFSFATIAVIGAAIVTARSMRTSRARNE
jgi:surfeit locus 1 family protein